MARTADQHTPKTLDDAARFLIEERGYEKNPALCWEILEQIWAGRIILRRHWKKYDLNSNPQEDGAEVVNRAVFRGRNLDFDRHGHMRFVSEWGGERYTIVEPCDFSIIWPPASQTAPDQQPADKAGPDPFKVSDVRTSVALPASEPPKRVSTEDWIKADAIQLKKDQLKNEKAIPANANRHISHFARLLERRMKKAAETNKSIRPVGWRHIKNMLSAWGLWPIESIKIS